MKEDGTAFLPKPPNKKWGKMVPKNNWIIGMGWNAVDDDGNPFRNLFRFQPTWNILPYPTRLTLDRNIKNGWSAEIIFCYNKYKPNKDINNVIISGNYLFLSLDAMAKYHFNQLAEH
jgi:OOP family OmpA-OmpF porin